MRTMLIVSVLTVLAAGASGCCRNPCGGGGWRPGQYLFGNRAAAPAAVPCCEPCDPCGGGGGYAAPAAMMQPVAMPTMTAAPCCQ